MHDYVDVFVSDCGIVLCKWNCFGEKRFCDGWVRTVNIERCERLLLLLLLSGMLVNQLVTSDVFFHWLNFVVFLIVELILSRICLLTLPSSLFAGLMRWQLGWLAKLSLWSFRVIKACCLAICSVPSSMLSSWAMDSACESMMLAASVLAFL